MNKKYKILYLSSWYPIPQDPSLGIFIKRHAMASAIYSDVTVVYATSDANVQKTVVANTKSVIREISIYYPKVKTKIPVLSQCIKLLSYCKNSVKGIRSAGKQPKGYDMVQVNIVFPAGILALFLKWFYGLPYILVENWTGYLASDGSYKGWLIKGLTKLIVKNSSGIVTVSKDLQCAMIQHGLKSNYFIIPNVVDATVFYPAFQQQIYSPGNSVIHILHVSTLNDEHKNIKGMINVIERVKNAGFSIMFHIVGEGPERKGHEQLCEQKGLINNYIKFYGYKGENEIAELMRQSHFLLLFSNFENLPCVMLEAMMCGLPIVSSQVGGIAEHITEERGILVRPKNENELVIAIQSMIENYDSYNKQAIAQYAQEHFSKEVVGEYFNSVYKEILK